MNCEIKGGNFPVAVCSMNKGEAILCESGGMAWMNGGLKMETNTGGGLGKMLGRAFTGESLFMNRYVADLGPGMLAIGAHAPGEIRKIEITPDKPIVVQKGSFLAMDESVDLSVFFQKKVGTGLFGGEGFIMNKLSGSGTALLEIDGGAVEYDLAPGEKLVCDTGVMALMDESVTMEIQTVKGLKNKMFGGEGLFDTVLIGPGKVSIQTMTAKNVANLLIPFLPLKK